MVSRALFEGVLVPALVAAAVWSLGWALRGDASRTASLSVAAAYPAGHAAIVGWPAFPPVEATQWLVYLALGAGALAALGGRNPLAGWWPWASRLALAVAVPVLLLRPLVTHRWNALQSATWIGGSALVIVALTKALEALGRRSGAGPAPLALAVCAAAGSAVLLVSGSALVAQLASVLAGTVGALTLAAWIRPQRAVSGALFPAVAVYAGLLLAGLHYVEVPATSASLLAAAPLSVWLTRVRPLRGLTAWKLRAAAVVLALLPGIAAFVVAWNRTGRGGFPY